MRGPGAGAGTGTGAGRGAGTRTETGARGDTLHPVEPQATFGPNSTLPGTPYVLVQKIGSGAMGDVYEAYHSLEQTTVALKVMATRHLSRADFAERMKNEALTLGRIRHKNLVSLLDSGLAADGRLYFAMELLRGHTLRKTIEANAPVRPNLAIELVCELLAGLQAAHDADVIHRDIKPENIFVCATGEVKLLDFGVAKMGQLTASLTQTGFSLGTPQYMAPEQIEGKTLTPRADLYAVGLVLYELLTRKIPFEDKEPLALAFAHATRPPPPPSSRLPAPLPARLEAAVLRALEKSPTHRFASADEFAAALRASLDDRATADGTSATEARSGQHQMVSGQTVRMELPHGVQEPIIELSPPFSASPAVAVHESKPSERGALWVALAVLIAVGAGVAAWTFTKKAVPVAASVSVPASVAVAVAASVPASVPVPVPVPVPVAVPSALAVVANSAPAVRTLPRASASSSVVAPVHSTSGTRRPGSGL